MKYIRSLSLNEYRTDRYVCEDEQIEEFKELVGKKFMCVNEFTRPNEYGDKKPRSSWITAGEVFTVNQILYSINAEETFDEYVINVEPPTNEEKTMIELGIIEPVTVEFFTLKISPPTKSHNNILPQFTNIGEFHQHFRVYQEGVRESISNRERYMYVDTDGSMHLIPASLNLDYFQSIIGKRFRCKKDFNTGGRNRRYIGIAVGNLFVPKVVQVLVKTENDNRFFSANEIRVATGEELIMAELQIIPTIKLGDIEVQLIGKTKISQTWSNRFPYKQKFLDHFVEAQENVNESTESDTLFELGLITEFEKIMADFNFERYEEFDRIWYEKQTDVNTIMVDDNGNMYVVSVFDDVKDIDQEITSDLVELRSTIEGFIKKYQS